MATPRAKIILQPSDLIEFLQLTEDVEIISVTCEADPPSVVVIIASESEFTEMYVANYGKYHPDLASMTIPKTHFKDKKPKDPK